MQDRAERTLISLDGQWTLYYATETGGKNQDYRPGMEKTWPAINASVPGNSELALMQAGAAPDPFYDCNQLEYAKYEYYQWLYVKRFAAPCLSGELQSRALPLGYTSKRQSNYSRL